MKKHNFSAGPSILPKSVIEQSAKGVLNINNSNLSLIEISHRSKDFIEIMNNATNLALDLLNLQNMQPLLQSYCPLKLDCSPT